MLCRNHIAFLAFDFVVGWLIKKDENTTINPWKGAFSSHLPLSEAYILNVSSLASSLFGSSF